jgi:hypothetical protein
MCCCMKGVNYILFSSLTLLPSAVFCCIGALAIAEALDRLDADDIDLLGWWLSERQVDSGGLNGRPEKQADVVSHHVAFDVSLPRQPILT